MPNQTPINGGKSTGPKGITKEEIADALRRNNGVIAKAAKQLRCRRDNLAVRINADAELMAVIPASRERMKDLAESNVFDKIEKGDVETSKWYLTLHGKDRGYVRKVEHAGHGAGGAIEHTVRQTTTVTISEETLEFVRRRYIDDNADE